MLTPTQALLIRTSFAALKPQASVVGLLFYQRLFEIAPALRPMFRNDILVQSDKFLQMLTTVVEWLESPERLIPVLEESGRRHVEFGVQDEHYSLVGDALLHALGNSLAPAWNPAMREAWASAYHFIATTMQSGAGSK